MIDIHQIEFPSDCRVVNHDFYKYEPIESFSAEHSLRYLNEDLLQCAFPADDVIIDMGWYGDPMTNRGEFKIQVIKHENWEIPFNTLHSKSALEVAGILSKILLYYTKEEPKEL
jgi:hypothetical protein